MTESESSMDTESYPSPETGAEVPPEDDLEDNYEADAIQLKKMQRPLKLTIPELLALRQEYGTSPLSLPAYTRPRRLITSSLSAKVAWYVNLYNSPGEPNISLLVNNVSVSQSHLSMTHREPLTSFLYSPQISFFLHQFKNVPYPDRNPSRLQNMILVCGPGTPAAIVDLSAAPPPEAAPVESQADGDASSSSSSSSEESGGSPDDNPGPMEQPVQTTQSSSEAFSRSRSASSASSSSTSPKRTLSDRMKMPEEEPQPQQQSQQHDMNLSTTSSGDDSDDDKTDGATNRDEKPSSKRFAWTKKAEEKDENMLSNSDREEENMGGQTESDDANGQETNDGPETGDKSANEAEEGEEKNILGARERFLREIDHAEGNQMDTEDEDGEDDEEDDAEEVHPQPRSRRRLGTGDADEETDDDEDDEEMADFREMAAEWFAMEQAAQAEADSESEEDDDDDDDSDDEDRAAARIIIRRRLTRRSLSPSARANRGPKAMKPALRHGGCINTAAWLQAGWSLSTVSPDHFTSSFNANIYDAEDSFTLLAELSDDCPTQLVTSGDDRLVKFWDVRHAMGSANPLPWGRNTHCPFAYDTSGAGDSQTGYRNRWRDFYYKQRPVEPWKMFGNVLPLATLHTGHRGNVFHVTPLWKQPGKVATCGADGYLRLGDVEAGSSGDSSNASIIISPEYVDDGSDHMLSGLFSLRPPMCFSHHFLNSNVGLVCGEKGLRKFDIRLPPRQQERTPPIGWNCHL
jgi:hypothetical protein